MLKSFDFTIKRLSIKVKRSRFHDKQLSYNKVIKIMKHYLKTDLLLLHDVSCVFCFFVVFLFQRTNEPISTFMIQIAVLANHQNGRDTHMRQIKVYTPVEESSIGKFPRCTTVDFMMYRTIRWSGPTRHRPTREVREWWRRRDWNAGSRWRTETDQSLINKIYLNIESHWNGFCLLKEHGEVLVDPHYEVILSWNFDFLYNFLCQKSIWISYMMLN